ncbi:MAG: nucleoside diphosphate kinase regulator [Alphaproteobacteria bacterium]|nr:nucleoside diphosphate kinase regulator [Alphaproteobacteria bacterium]
MRKNISNRDMPAITVSNTDRDQLRRLAVSAMDRMPEVANELLTEIERATIVASPAVPPNVIQMGSTAEIVAGGDGRRRVTLVFPSDADISSGKVSILTPIGAALIGLSEGQSIIWSTRDGREQQMTVLAVEPMTVGA